MFAHDTVAGLRAAAALVNTGVNGRDTLTTTAGLAVFLDGQQFSGRRDGNQTELAQVRAVRDRLATAWPGARHGGDHVMAPGADRFDLNGGTAVVDLVNDLLREAGAAPFLSDHDGTPWHLHVTPPTAPLAHRMAAEAAMAFADLIRAGEMGRLGRCAGAGCEAVLVDLTRNRSRRFCDLADANCGNRENVAAYRARRRAVARG